MYRDTPPLSGFAQVSLFCGLLSTDNMPLSYLPRHGNSYDVVCCDGHVQGMEPLVLFNPTNTAQMWNRDHQPHPESW